MGIDPDRVQTQGYRKTHLIVSAERSVENSNSIAGSRSDSNKKELRTASQPTIERRTLPFGHDADLSLHAVAAVSGFNQMSVPTRGGCL
jgi:hypothetical protein